MSNGETSSQSFYVVVPDTMPRQRIVQDSDDEDGSDVATSIDPLQEEEDDANSTNNKINPQNGLGSVETRSLLVSTTGDAESELPQVDFDRFLQSDDNEIGVNAMNFGPVEAREERPSFAMSPTQSVDYPGLNPSASDLHQAMDDAEERQAKRRRISPENGGEWWLVSSAETGASYNFVESIRSECASVAATGHSQPRSQEQFDTPPPTVPFSETSREPVPGVGPVSTTQEPVPVSTDADDVLNTNGSMAKEQKTSDSNKQTDRNVQEERAEKQPTKRRGRQKKQADDAPKTAVAAAPSTHADKEGKSPAPTGTESDKRTKKRKVKRSKTTSDIPDAKTNNIAAGVDKDVIWIDNDEDASAPTTRQRDSSDAEPKTRGRKKKRKEKDSTPKPDIDADVDPQPNTTVLQDIPNTPSKKPPSSNPEARIEKTSADVGVENRPQGELSPSPDPLAEPPPPPQDSARKLLSGKPGSFTVTSKVPYRVGLSRKARVAPLLKVVRK